MRARMQRRPLLILPPFQAGEDSGAACADAGLESGSLDIGVSYHGFPIYTQSQDLCDATRCPIKKGPLTVKLEEPFPVITPPVRLLSQAQSCPSVTCFQAVLTCILL